MKIDQQTIYHAIPAYIRQFCDDAYIGMTHDATGCLVAHAVRFAYPDAYNVSVSTEFLALCMNGEENGYFERLIPELAACVQRFDGIDPGRCKRVTKAEWNETFGDVLTPDTKTEG